MMPHMKRKSKLSSCLLASAVLSLFLPAARGTVSDPAADGDQGIPFELKDQFGKPHAFAFPRDRIGVLLLADRGGSDQLENWIRPLHARYGESVSIQGIAKLAGVPGPMKGVLRFLFRQQVRHPVLLDWTGEIYNAFNCRDGVANLVVLDRTGRIEHRAAGPATDGEKEKCFSRIDALLAPP